MQKSLTFFVSFSVYIRFYLIVLLASSTSVAQIYIGEGTIVSFSQGTRLVIVEQDSVYEFENNKNKILITQKDIDALLKVPSSSEIIKNKVEKIKDSEQSKVVSNEKSNYQKPILRSSGRNEQSISSLKRNLISIQTNKYNHLIFIETDLLITTSVEFGVFKTIDSIEFVILKDRNIHSFSLRGPPFYS